MSKGQDLSNFKEWLPDNLIQSDTYALAPLYLVKSWEKCWKCGKIINVFCLASEGFEEKDISEDLEEENILDKEIIEDYSIEGFTTYSNLKFVPPPLDQYLKNNWPTYCKDYSKTTKDSYYINHCSCGAKIGDFFLHNEPEGAFQPIDKTQAREIELREINTAMSKTAISALPVQQDLDLIFKYAKRNF